MKKQAGLGGLRYAALCGSLIAVVGCGGDPGDQVVGGGACKAIPQGDYCSDVADWPQEWSDFERQVVELVNIQRSLGFDCGKEGYFPPVPALAVNPALRCAARAHSLDMQEQDYFDHVNPSCEEPWDRMERAGYRWIAAGENIAVGQPTPTEVMTDWMQSDGHCANVMSPGYSEIGIGYFYETDGSSYRHYWTQNFGMPL